MGDPRKLKLSKDQYLKAEGIKCPFCAEEGGIEAHHSFDYLNHQAYLGVVCTKCGEYYTEVYVFHKWQSDDNKIGNDIRSCPHCSADISDEYIEGLTIEDIGVVYGEITCSECEEVYVPVFNISGWRPAGK